MKESATYQHLCDIRPEGDLVLSEVFHPKRLLVVGTGGVSLEEFLG